MDCGADAGHAGRVRTRQVVAITERNLRVDFDLAADVSKEGLVCSRRQCDAFQSLQQIANLATVLRIAQVAGEVEDHSASVGIGDIEASHLSTGF